MIYSCGFELPSLTCLRISPHQILFELVIQNFCIFIKIPRKRRSWVLSEIFLQIPLGRSEEQFGHLKLCDIEVLNSSIFFLERTRPVF